MVVTFDDVKFEYANKVILDGASFSITDNDKIGVVGINGTGKTTLVKLITGEETPLKGEIIKSGGMIISVLPQEPKFDQTKTILEIILESSTKEHPILEYEAKSMLSKFGFQDADIKPINFSGGENKRLALAKALISYADLLILDEPTNHLDASTIVFLEKYLMKYKGTLLLITHDRYFLERVCKKMLEIDFGKTYMYDANYNEFLELKALRIEREEASKRKLSNILRREKEWINRGAEARSTKQKARIENYNNLLEIKFNNRDNDMKFESLETRLGKKLIELKNASKEFPGKVIFKNFNYTLKRDDRIGVVGENGVGKSTFFKILVGLEPLSSGELIKGETLNIGYFSQHLDLEDENERIIDYIEEDMQVIKTSDGFITASQLLERFLFDRYKQYMSIKSLSGGEKRRLQLVKVLAKNPNILILDEPTNDLDIFTLQILEDYLLSFNGPILTVSHDRYFLDKIAQKLFIFNDSKIQESNLMYSDYLDSYMENIATSNKDTKEDYLKQQQKSKEIAKNKKEYNKLSETINNIESEIESLKNDLKKETTDYIKMMDIQSKIDNLVIDEEKYMDRLLELEEILNNF